MLWRAALAVVATAAAAAAAATGAGAAASATAATADACLSPLLTKVIDRQILPAVCPLDFN